MMSASQPSSQPSGNPQDGREPLPSAGGRALAHDLKNWLTPVQTCLQLWARGETRAAEALRPAAQANLAAALAGVEHELARGIMPAAALPEVRLDMLLHRAAALAAPQAQALDISIQVRADQAVTLQADEVLLLRLLSNLLANGLRAAPPGACLQLAAGPHSERAGWVWLTVTNPCADAEIAGGTRLGLRICREIVALHGGRMDVRLEEQADGVCVRVELPVAPGARKLDADG